MRIDKFISHESFKKHFKRMPKKVQSAFGERVGLLLKQPVHSILRNHPLKGRWQGCWSINVTGDIRAVYKVQADMAIFIDIGTHDQLYDS
ncbi:MAG: type II toxin-antitoxin system mRNA interferase toxin, RelE/StbE family [Patescibacteria group bacterium]|nr:type II toxin-antitoxin system mRNA interferase toxin, RelE/StbE family [Patescibacteria group bacterium]